MASNKRSSSFNKQKEIEKKRRKKKKNKINIFYSYSNNYRNYFISVEFFNI